MKLINGSLGTVSGSASTGWSNPTTNQSNFGIVRSKNVGATLLAIGQTGGSIATSTDAINWQFGVIPNVGAALRDIAFNGAGQTVVVGDASSANSGIFVSNNLSTWTAVSIAAFPTTTRVSGIAYGAGKYVVVSNNGYTATSTNGTDWTSSVSEQGQTFQKVSYLQSSSLFVAVLNGGKIKTSTDGVTWTSRATPTSLNIYDIHCSPTECISAVSFGSSAFPSLVRSTNGIDWATVFTNTDNSLVFGLNYVGSTWYAAGEQGLLITSTNGATWTKVPPT